MRYVMATVRDVRAEVARVVDVDEEGHVLAAIDRRYLAQVEVGSSHDLRLFGGAIGGAVHVFEGVPAAELGTLRGRLLATLLILVDKGIEPVAIAAAKVLHVYVSESDFFKLFDEEEQTPPKGFERIGSNTIESPMGVVIAAAPGVMSEPFAFKIAPLGR